MEVLRERDREIFRQVEAPDRRQTGSMPRFGNEELAEKIRSRRGLTFTTGSYGRGAWKQSAKAPPSGPCPSTTSTAVERGVKDRVNETLVNCLVRCAARRSSHIIASASVSIVGS